jgi:hypothetical protein
MNNLLSLLLELNIFFFPRNELLINNYQKHRIMKKTLTLLSLVILFSSVLSAQSLYIRVGGGYGLPIGTASIGEKYLYNQINTTITSTTTSAKNVRASYGAGGNFNFAIGYKFNENIIFDLGIQYLMSNKFQTSDIRNYTYSTSSSISRDVITTSAKAFLFDPSVIFTAGFGKGAPYAKFGIIIGTPTLTKNESSFDNTDGTSAYNQTWKYNKGIGVGYQGAVGYSWKLSDKLDLFSEVNFVSMTYYAGESNMTKFQRSNDGITFTDNLPNLQVSQKQTVYKNSFDPSVPNDGTKPTIALKEATPFSSISLQVGIRFLLWKKKE